ncbi:MAG: hypothetical protein IKV37_03375, partial [Prevotella sp.]|nr:hypothetical protein [Prevotella sp.]
MNKKLRFSLLSMLMMLCGSVFGQTTFDFDANANELFGIPGSSSGSNDSYVADGEFNETKTATINGISVTVSASDAEATTRNRIWATSPKLRLYNGTLTITAPSGKSITNLSFAGLSWNSSKKAMNFNATVEVGTLTVSSEQSNKTAQWEGTSNSVVLTIGSNTQIGKLTVTLDGEGSGGEGGDDEFTGPTVNDIAAFKALGDKTEAKLMLSNAMVLYAKGSDIFVRDNSGAIDFYNTGLKLTAGQVLNGFVVGKYTLFRNLPELAKTDYTNADSFTTTEGTVTPKNVGLDEVSGLVCDLVLIEGVSIAKEEDGNYY